MDTYVIYFGAVLLTTYGFYSADNLRSGKKYIVSVLIAIGIPVFVAGFRYSVGSDYFPYINGFNLIKVGGQVRWSNVEVGYVFLNTVLVRMGLPPQSIMFATSLLTMSFITKSLIDKRDEISLGYGALAFMLLFYLSTFNVIRLMIASSIFLYNIINIERRDLFRFVIFTFLAASFHTSALVTFPVYWVFGIKDLENNMVKNITIFAIVGLGIIFFNPILGAIIQVTNMNYYRQYIGFSGNPISVAFNVLILYSPMVIPGCMLFNKLKDLNNSFHIYYSLTVIGVIIKVLSIFQQSYVDRISIYFLIPSIVLIPLYLKLFKKDNNILYSAAMIIYMIIYFVYTYFIIKDHGTVPYQWIF